MIFAWVSSDALGGSGDPRNEGEGTRGEGIDPAGGLSSRPLVTVTKRPRFAQTITGRYDRDQRMAGVKQVQFAKRVLWHVRLVAVEAPLQTEDPKQR